MAQSAGDFESWLSAKLKELNTDDTVFGSYITGILEGEDSYDDKNEALEGILSEIVPEEEQQSSLCSEIVLKWNDTQSHKALTQQATKDNVEVQLTKIMEAQAQCTVQQRPRTDDENKLKQSILAHYAEVSDEEEEVAKGGGGGPEESAGATGGATDYSRNTNLEDILKSEKSRREKLKQEALKKKEKDKEDREKQKVTAAERKDKEKKRTQKGEKKR
nr:EOG090X0H15 [Lepidurus arcticus]